MIYIYIYITNVMITPSISIVLFLLFPLIYIHIQTYLQFMMRKKRKSKYCSRISKLLLVFMCIINFIIDITKQYNLIFN